MRSRSPSFFAVLLCGLLACGGDDPAPAPSCGHTQSDLIGGWQAPFSLRACFAADHRMWIGSSDYDIMSRSHCTTTEDACRYECTDLGGGEPYGGSLEVLGDQLNVSADDCVLGPGMCVGAYLRDPTVMCQQ
jgi:hypothetical protein